MSGRSLRRTEEYVEHFTGVRLWIPRAVLITVFDHVLASGGGDFGFVRLAHRRWRGDVGELLGKHSVESARGEVEDGGQGQHAFSQRRDIEQRLGHLSGKEWFGHVRGFAPCSRGRGPGVNL
jgi:hypothetical protein